jgi:hypothetical protein
VTSSPILRFAHDAKAFQVEADSSDFATGVVLSQQSSDDLKWHPIAFYSKSLNTVEQNYKIHDKEMLAVMRALEEWRHFLKGAKHKVEIWMDHKNLEYFMTAKKLNCRQARWSLYLSRFDFVMHHLGRAWASATPSRDRQTTALARRTTVTQPCCAPNFLWSMHSKALQWRAQNEISCGTFARGLRVERTRTQWSWR